MGRHQDTLTMQHIYTINDITPDTSLPTQYYTKMQPIYRTQKPFQNILQKHPIFQNLYPLSTVLDLILKYRKPSLPYPKRAVEEGYGSEKYGSEGSQN